MHKKRGRRGHEWGKKHVMEPLMNSTWNFSSECAKDTQLWNIETLKNVVCVTETPHVKGQDLNQKTLYLYLQPPPKKACQSFVQIALLSLTAMFTSFSTLIRAKCFRQVHVFQVHMVTKIVTQCLCASGKGFEITQMEYKRKWIIKEIVRLVYFVEEWCWCGTTFTHHTRLRI